MSTPVEDLGTILGVWAHPDDETYLTAGLMVTAIRNGQRVVCATATRGEEGSWDEERWPTATMGQVRQGELERCLAILGVTEHHWLDYRDATLEGVDRAEATAKVLALFEQAQPDTVLTFGPDGMTDHADHKAVCSWTTEVFEQAAKPGARLYYATQTPEWADRFVPVLNRFNVFGPGTPPVTPVDELGIHHPLPPDTLELKLKAILEHTSQVEGMVNAFGEDFFRDSMNAEFFRLARVAGS